MIRTNMLVMVEIHDFRCKRTMAYHLEKTAQNRSEAPLRRADNESDFGRNGQEEYRGGPAHTWASCLDKQAPVPAAIAAGLKLDELLHT